MYTKYTQEYIQELQNKYDFILIKSPHIIINDKNYFVEEWFIDLESILRKPGTHYILERSLYELYIRGFTIKNDY